MSNKFFVNPFGEAGDLTPIPDPTQVSGSVSYASGWGFDYQRTYPTDPAALTIPRAQMNQLFFDITQALQQYQTYGIPNFITTTQNLGTPYSYSKYAMALYDDGVHGLRPYQSLVNSNTALPTDSTKWKLIENTGSSLIYPNAVFDSAVNDGDAVYYNAGASKFMQALADQSSAQNVIGIADKTNGRVFISGYVPGLLSGLTPNSVYFLSSSVPGQFTTIPGQFSAAVQLGTAFNATDVFLNIQLSKKSGYFRAYLGSAQSIATGAAATVLLDTATSNFYNFFDTTAHQLKPTFPCAMQVRGRGGITSPTSGAGFYVELLLNSTIIADYAGATAVAGALTTEYVSSTVFFNGTTDFLTLLVGNNTGSSASLDTSPTSNYLEGHILYD